MASAHDPRGTPGRALSLPEFWQRIDPPEEPPVRANARLPEGVTTLVVPGLHGSGERHWQSLWCGSEAECRRVELGEWDAPSRDLWVARLDRAIARERQPVILAAHSLGCHAVAWWAAEASTQRLQKVVAAMLVAPPDVDRRDADPLIRAFAPAPRATLPFPSLLIASRDDRYARFERLAAMAEQWGAGLVDVGRRGHINAESGLGDWPEGRALLRALGTPWSLDAAGLDAATGYAMIEAPAIGPDGSTMGDEG